MRLGTYLAPDGSYRAAVVVSRDSEDHVIDIGQSSAGRLPSDTLTLIGLGPSAIGEVQRLVEFAPPIGPLASVALGPPIRRPPKLIATAGNYQAHVLEVGRAAVEKRRVVPKLFLKPSTTVLAPGAELRLPTISVQIDWEVELAVVIGRSGREVALDDALNHVFGYSIINDVSARSMDWNVPGRQPTPWDGFFDFLAGKWPDGFAPFGPWITTSDEIPDPQSLGLELRVNSLARQQGSTREMIFSVAELIAFITRFMTLEPGDVISTGTPAGVGKASGSYLKPGDLMEASIERLGILRTPVGPSDP
jgi:2-keto-4-pentenoate hydratase/2-oxohepta-3-ene-1,7-dioic acid hydratase in catechol pathway